jgi:hypothetical protein
LDISRWEHPQSDSLYSDRQRHSSVLDVRSFRAADCNKRLEIRESIKISAKESLHYYELKQDKPWFDEGCSKLLDQRKQAKLQWLQDPSEINGDNLSNVRHEATHISGIK